MFPQRNPPLASSRDRGCVTKSLQMGAHLEDSHRTEAL